MHATHLHAWGFYAHQLINRMAVFALPPEMFFYFKSNLQYISEHAIDPDKLRYVNDDEAVRHYIDLEYFMERSQDIDTLPHNVFEPADSVVQFGILPSTLIKQYYLLVHAFKSGNHGFLMTVVSHTGHYIADAHVPLHTTKNYNGQFTGQHGIHSLWETQIPKLSAHQYDFLVGRALPIAEIKKFVWGIISHSHGLVNKVLTSEKMLSEQYGQDRIFKYERTHSTVKRTYQSGYVLAYETSLNGMVENQMQRATLALASFWYTAWIEAGQPDLTLLLHSIESKDDAKRHKKTPPQTNEKGQCR